MKSILRTLQEMTIGGNTMETLMNTKVQHQGKKKYTPDYTQSRGTPNRGRKDENHQEYEEDDQDCQDHEGYTTEQDYDHDYQEHEDYDQNCHDDRESQEFEPQDEGGDDYSEESQGYEPQDEGGDACGEKYQDEDQNQDREGDERQHIIQLQ